MEEKDLISCIQNDQSFSSENDPSFHQIGQAASFMALIGKIFCLCIKCQKVVEIKMYFEHFKAHSKPLKLTKITTFMKKI